MTNDLARVFGERLISLLAYGDGGHRMAVVRSLTHADLAALMPLVPRWRAAGLETPLLLTYAELTASPARPSGTRCCRRSAGASTDAAWSRR